MFIGQGMQLKRQKAPLAYGTLFKEPLTSIGNWTNIGSGSFTASGTGLTIGAGATDYLKWLEYDPLPNTSENFLVFFQVEVLAMNSILATSVQTRRLVAGAHKKTFIGAFITNATNGHSVIATYADGTSTTVSNVADSFPTFTNINCSIGHILNYSLRRSSINQYICTVFNTNTGLQVSAVYSDIPDASPVVVAANNACKFAIQCVSGSFRILPDTFIVTSDDFRNVRALFVGDSRTTFMSASPATNRYPNIVFAGSGKRYAVDAGAYDMSSQYSIQGAFINSFGADYVFLGGLMRNGVFYGISQATNRADYTTIRDNANAGGAKVVHILFPNDSSATMTTENAWVVSTFTSDLILDLSGNTYGYADGVHFNNTGHASIGADIRTAMPWLY